MSSQTEVAPTPKIVWAVVLLLVAIGVAIVIRRAISLWMPAPPPARFPDAAALDGGFAPHRILTTVHIIPGLLFVVLCPLQFVSRLRRRKPAFHRWIGRVVVVSGAIVGVSALAMSAQMSIGGATETAATMSFGVFFLIALSRGYLLIRQRRIALHREWMIRAFAVGLAVTTTRPIVGVFFATRGVTHLTPHDFFGIAFWLGFTSHLVAAELWIRRTRAQAAMDRGFNAVGSAR